MVVRYRVILSYCVIISSITWSNATMFYSINRNNYIIDVIKLLGKVGEKILQKISYWVTKNLNQNFWALEFWLSKYFGLDTVHHFADPKFRVPKLKSLLVLIFQTMHTTNVLYPLRHYV